MYAKLAPTGDRVAYVRGGEIYVEHLASAAITGTRSVLATVMVVAAEPESALAAVNVMA